ncbi:MAG: metalloregulator ArsR/SmtB family transcription factor [Desulfobulbaceae bacterium]|nr:metalloregulator ArsR/SmtB family transcription factor [Desulfobulbaceae bacterium]
MKTTVHLIKALSDETRLRILALLQDGELCVCDLMSVLQLPQSTVSRHLAYLRNAGWAEDRRQNKWMYYQLNRETSGLQKKLLTQLQEHLAQLAQIKNDRKKLQDYLASKKEQCC